MTFLLYARDAVMLEQALTAELAITTDGTTPHLIGWQANGLPFFAWWDDRLDPPFAAAVGQCEDGNPNNGHVSELVYPVLIPHLDTGDKPVTVERAIP